MSETVKTVIFAAVAVIAVLAAVFTYPKQEEYRPPDHGRQVAVRQVHRSGHAAELKITKFAEDLGQLTEFEVVRNATSGLWMIPSSSNYPADAEAQMRDAATSLDRPARARRRLGRQQGPSSLRRDRAGSSEAGCQPGGRRPARRCQERQRGRTGQARSSASGSKAPKISTSSASRASPRCTS